MKKKRLLIDVNSVVPFFATGRTTGIGRTTLELVKALDDIRDELPFDVTLFSQNMKGIGGRNIETGFRCKHLYLPHRPKFDRIARNFALREMLSPYDLMHVPHNYEIVRRPEKCIVTLHDALFMKLQEQQFNHARMAEIVPPFIRQCKHIITCSAHSKKDICETMGVAEEKVSVIYWGINHRCFHPLENRGDISECIKQRHGITRPFYMSVSCNMERKRTDVLVRSFMEFCKINDSCDLALVWRNPPENLVNEVKTAGMAERVHFLRNIDDEELTELLNCAKALCFVSKYEGFGLPIIEAMACGCPVITCRNSCLQEIGGDAAIYVEEPINESLVALFQQIDKHQEMLVSKIEPSIEQADKFHWHKAARQYAELYERLL